jgi:hypothetical protein
LAAEENRPFIDEPVPMSQLSPDEITETEWQEQGVTLPPFPKDDDLLEFSVDRPGDRFRYYIDGANLALGEDGVMRYVLVAVSRRGARNIFFEGMHCGNREYKTYAYGMRDGSFMRVEAPYWQEVRGTDISHFRDDLMDFYLCEAGLANRVDDVIAMIRSGGIKRTQRADIF